MSIVFECELGWYVSHHDFLNKLYEYVNVDGKSLHFKLREQLFKINVPYKQVLVNRQKRLTHNLETDSRFDNLFEEVKYVQGTYELFRKKLPNLENTENDENMNKRNTEALEVAQSVYEQTGKNDLTNIIGANELLTVFTKVRECNYLFPKACKFYCKHVKGIMEDLCGERYDFVLLDPPWWNKYIRRKRFKSNDGYNMMYSDDIQDLPVGDLITDDGLVAVWCTNSPQHLDELRNMFDKWRIEYIGQWFWLKITKSGLPVCKFSDPPNKQPFERIVFGSRNQTLYKNIKDRTLIVSVPSALHSHKPPLNDILKKFIPKDPKCLEIFARYLLPNWTSYGLEAIRFQHESLFTVTNIDVQYKEVVTVKDSTCTSDVNRHKSEEAPTHSEAEVCNI